jgi:hypothetical protein
MRQIARFIIFALLMKSTTYLSVAYAEELILIQAISTTEKTFVIRKGAEDGVTPGQESLFSNRNISLMARAVEVTRDFSLWKLIEEQANVPFEKRELVTFNSSSEGLWLEIPKLRTQINQISYFKPSFHWKFRTSFARSISETTSDTAAETEPTRNGVDIEILYGKRFHPRFEWDMGFRYDYETSRLEEPVLVVSTRRYFLTGEVTYHFSPEKRSKGNYYMALGIGAGLSNTIVDEDISAGYSLLLPTASIGYTGPLNENWGYTFNLNGESVSTKEVMPTGEVVSSTIILTKFTVGLRF